MKTILVLLALILAVTVGAQFSTNVPTAIGVSASRTTNAPGTVGTNAPVFSTNATSSATTPAAAVSPAFLTQLRAWAVGSQYQELVMKYDAYGNLTNATVLWPDLTGGVFSVTNINSTWHVVDGWTLTYTNYGKTITMPTPARDSSGRATNSPAIVITP